MKQRLYCLVSVFFALTLFVCLITAPAYAAVETSDRDIAEWVDYGGIGATPLDSMILSGCTPVSISIIDPDKVLVNTSVQRQENGADFLLSYAVVNDAN